MPQPPLFYVWEWVDETGAVVFIGHGKIENGEHPADITWDKRRVLNSPIGRWLSELSKQPARSKDTINQPMYEHVCEALYTQRLRHFKKQNVALLNTRPFGTWAGGGESRAVIAPDGTIFKSLSKAAEAYGLSKTTIARFCSKDTSDWMYADQLF